MRTIGRWLALEKLFLLPQTVSGRGICSELAKTLRPKFTEYLRTMLSGCPFWAFLDSYMSGTVYNEVSFHPDLDVGRKHSGPKGLLYLQWP